METTESLAGHISEVGLLNLMSAKSEADIEAIQSISYVGLILVPEHLAIALNRIPMKEVGAIAPVPAGDKVTLFAGQARMTGESLAEGDPDTVLFVAGQLMVSTPVSKVGFKGIHVAGQLMAPRGSETAIGNALRTMMGQVLYVPVGSRYFIGDEVFDEAFLTLLDEPTPMVLIGSFRFADDVQFSTLKEKVPEIVLAGSLEVPPAILSLAKVLTIEKHGSISASSAPAE